MSRIERHALVRHSAKKMFDLVNDVARYPRLFDWCEASQIIESSPEHMLARLDLRMGGLRTYFVTRNSLVEPTRIEMNLVEGPFTKLYGLWTFHTLAEDACKATLVLDFELAGKLMGGALALGFSRLADRMVDDFCKAADRDE
jgi:ribosome-associated toxin RatA of RatAB toxin-antitoxin module